MHDQPALIPGTPTEPSELAQGLAKLVEAFDRQAARDLERLLAYSIGLPKPGELREARLGLLIEMVSDGSGQMPNVRAYLAERDRRVAEGEDGWPAPSTLINAYGSFQSAVRAAMRLAFEGSKARVPGSLRSIRGVDNRKYTRQEAVAGLLKFFYDEGHWPRHSEWVEWATRERRLAQQQGRPSPRLPSLNVLTRLFGSFDRALAVARRWASM